MTLSLTPARLARAWTESAALLSSAYMVARDAIRDEWDESGHDQHGYVYIIRELGLTLCVKMRMRRV